MAGKNGPKRRKVPTGSFPWTSKEAKIVQFHDTSNYYQSEYTVSYKARPLNKTRKSARPAHKPVCGQDFSGLTSYPIAKKEEVKQAYVKPISKVQAKTIYTQHYPEYSTKQRAEYTIKTRKPDTFSEPSTTFKGSSIYTTSYPPYDPELAQKCRSKAVKPSGNIFTPIHGEGDVVNSTSKVDFKPYPAITPPKPIIQSGKNLKTDSVYTETYVPHTVEPIVLAQAPRRTNSQTNVPFIAITTNMADYVNHGAVKREPCYHPCDNNALRSADIKFQGESTHAAAFKAWPVQERIVPVWGREKEYKRNPALLVTSSTYAAEFINPRVLHPVQAIRPSVHDVIIKRNGHSNYTMQSTYDASFPEWEGARPAELCKKQDNVYCSPADKMNTSSTKQSDYKGEQTKRATLCRRTSQYRELNSERKNSTFTTTYGDAFRGYQFKG